MIKNETPYIMIRYERFHPEDKLPFDLFIDENDDKKLYLEHTKPVSTNDIEFFKITKSVYIKRADENLYKLFAKKFTDRDAYKPKEVEAVKDKIDNVAANVKHALESLFDDPTSKENVDKFYSVVDDLIETTLNEELSTKRLFRLIANDYTLYAQALNVAVYALSLGVWIDISKEDLKLLSITALLHDIGKSCIDPNIIHKEGKLTDDESEIVKKHAKCGYDLVLKMGIEDKKVLSGIYHHHERLDGSGYPQGLRGPQISKFARIITICDIFDAMSTDKPYQKAKGSFEILLEMKNKMEDQLDMNLIKQFILMLKHSIS
jgi:HD-GYP domain-containing protein (c-di-GMP phosphodiesterase class II)